MPLANPTEHSLTLMDLVGPTHRALVSHQLLVGTLLKTRVEAGPWVAPKTLVKAGPWVGTLPKTLVKAGPRDARRGKQLEHLPLHHSPAQGKS